MLQGDTFLRQYFSVNTFAAFIDTFLGGACGIKNNYLNSFAMTYSGNEITIKSGLACIKGRFLREDSTSKIKYETIPTRYCKLVIEIDLSKDNEDLELKQAYYRILYSGTGYPTLTQEDIVNKTNGVYQFELAQFTITANEIGDWVDKRSYVDFDSIYNQINTTVSNYIANYDSKKADKTTVNNIQAQVNALASGSPLVASSISGMTDKNHVYVNTSDGKWYYWNGSAWTVGGIYQAIEIEDGSITPLKTNFFSYKSIFDLSTISTQKRLSTTGNTQTNNDYSTSDFIPVEVGQKIYVKSKFDRLCYYNVNKVSLSSYVPIVSNLENEETIVPNYIDKPKYMRICWKTTETSDSDVNIYDSSYIVPIKEFQKGSIPENAINFISTSNLDLIYLIYKSDLNTLKIYIPTSIDNVFIGYDFKHIIDANVNSNIWRMRGAKIYSKDNENNFTTLHNDLIIHEASEWECAIKETGKSDFIGGSTHGNEILENIIFFVDGKTFNNASSLNGKICKELRIIRKSNLYRQDDASVNIASHYVDYLFKERKITIDNRVDWKVNTNCGISYLTMLGIKRTNNDGQITSYGIKEGDGSILDISQTNHSATSTTKKCKKAYAWNDSIAGLKMFVSVELLDDDFLPNSNFKFDNRPDYNKFYFDHCGQDYNVVNGDIWHTKSQYFIDYLGIIE